MHIKRFVVVAILCLGLVVGVGTAVAGPLRPPWAGTATTTNRPASHVVGAWASNSVGGYILSSKGAVTALNHAPYYGSAVGKGNNFVGMITDTDQNETEGYWLITSTGQVYSFGVTCENGVLGFPNWVPTSGIVGAVGMDNEVHEGFAMIAASGEQYVFACRYLRSVVPAPGGALGS